MIKFPCPGRPAILAVLLFVLVCLAPPTPAGAVFASEPAGPVERREDSGHRKSAMAPYQVLQLRASRPAHPSPRAALKRGNHRFAKGILMVIFALMASGVLGLWAYLARAYAGRVRKMM